MTVLTGVILCLVVLLIAALHWSADRLNRYVLRQGLDQWVPTYVASAVSRKSLVVTDAEPIDVFIAVCDHYEPETGKCDRATALSRVTQWVQQYPEQFSRFQDVDGRPPQHTFFFPQDEYRPEYIEELAPLIRNGFGDLDIHLHHHNDTPDGFREKLDVFKSLLWHRHGLLRLHPVTGQIVYGFIHGNWALCNSRQDGKWCGVDHELPILLETGCYADFTFPSAPSDTQPQTINQIYYAFDQPQGRKSHNEGQRARVGVSAPNDGLLMIQGPLKFDWTRKKWGLVPRVENGDLLASHPPSGRRVDEWLNAGVIVAGRPNWRFVKLHTHGCKPGNLEMWLNGTAGEWHQALADRHRQNPNFRYHYVTAWEMAQLVQVAELKSWQFPWETSDAPAPSMTITPELLSF